MRQKNLQMRQLFRLVKTRDPYQELQRDVNKIDEWGKCEQMKFIVIHAK